MTTVKQWQSTLNTQFRIETCKKIEEQGWTVRSGNLASQSDKLLLESLGINNAERITGDLQAHINIDYIK